MGGSGTPGEVTDAVLEDLNIPESEQLVAIKNGASRVRNQVSWARFYLAKAGYIDTSERGVWSLTEKGLSTTLTPERVLSLFKEAQQKFPKGDNKPKLENSTEVVVDAPGRTTVNRGHAAHLSTSCRMTKEGRPRFLGRTQGGGGTRNRSNSEMVQR
ncbi:MAG: hypothetical protein EXR62_12820 [Chloroflexi bacterium]|nr:hypothetical protein [Chloroflexota bacterium]